MKHSTVTASNTTRRNWVTTYFRNKLDDPLLTKALLFQAGNKLNLLHGLGVNLCTLLIHIIFYDSFSSSEPSSGGNKYERKYVCKHKCV